MKKPKTPIQIKFTTTGWAEKHRPRKFSDMVGQDHIVNALKSAIKSRELPNAYLLHGGFGQGKTTTAFLLSRYLNCETLNACGKCPSCRESMELHPDVVEVNAAEARGIDDVRAMIQRAGFRPMYNVRIIILDEVHQYTAPAFGALLKTLEKPPGNTLFVLCTTEAHKIPGTILSRCVQLAVKPIRDEVMIERLKQIADLEKVKMHRKIFEGCARMAGGHARNAVNLLYTAHQIVSRNPDAKVDDILSQVDLQSLPGDDNVAMKLLNCIYNGKPQTFAKTCFDADSPYVVLGRVLYMNEALLALATNSRPQGMWISKGVQALFKTVPHDPAVMLSVHKHLAATRERASAFAVPERAYLLSSWINTKPPKPKG